MQLQREESNGSFAESSRRHVATASVEADEIWPVLEAAACERVASPLDRRQLELDADGDTTDEQ